MIERMKAQQARNDERDNRRVFRWGIGAAIFIFLLALAYNFLTQTREEGPVKPETPVQSAPASALPQASPGNTAPASTPGK